MRSGEADPGAMVAAGLAALDGACLGVGQALEFAGALLDRVDHVGRASATAEKRLGWVRLATAVADRARGLADLLVGEAEAAEASERAQGTPMTTWLTLDERTGRREATRAVLSGRELVEHERVRAAVLAGEASVAHARATHRVLAELPESFGAGERARAEEWLVERARRATPPRLAKSGPELLEALGHPESSLTEAERAEARYRVARLRRFVRFTPDGQGSTLIFGSLPTAECAGLERLIAAYEQSERRGARDARDREALRRTPGQRRADALVRLVAEHARPGRAPKVAGDRPRVVVSLSYDTMVERAEQAGLIGGEACVPPGELRRLLCDADVMPVVLGSRSQPVDLGVTRRLVDAALRQALSERDRGCVFPGCDGADAECEAHHIIPWWMLGPTALENLVLLCPHHHRLCEPVRFWTGPDPGRWEVRLGHDGVPEVLPPDRVDGARVPRRHERFRRLDDGPDARA